jgi:hypothetical protein
MINYELKCMAIEEFKWEDSVPDRMLCHWMVKWRTRGSPEVCLVEPMGYHFNHWRNRTIGLRKLKIVCTKNVNKPGHQENEVFLRAIKPPGYDR